MSFLQLQVNKALNAVNQILTTDNRNKNQRYTQLGSHNQPNDSIHKTGEWKMNETQENMANSEILQKVSEGLLSTDVGRRENIGVEEFTRLPRNEATSHSLLGNLSGTDHKIKGRLSKENSTVSINLKKQVLPHGYEQSLSNMIKYDTTAVISEEYSNYEDPFTQMYTNSILSG